MARSITPQIQPGLVQRKEAMPSATGTVQPPSTRTTLEVIPLKNGNSVPSSPITWIGPPGEAAWVGQPTGHDLDPVRQGSSHRRRILGADGERSGSQEEGEDQDE